MWFQSIRRSSIEEKPLSVSYIFPLLVLLQVAINIVVKKTIESKFHFG